LLELRKRPVETIHAALPKLQRITGAFDGVGDVTIRPADLYVSTGYQQPGIAMIGDAFATTCPATGTGTDKVFTDVVQLCDVYVPKWLKTDGMGAEKIASFYDDPVKMQCDSWSSAKAFSFRAVSIATEIYWKAQRWARFFYWVSRGILTKLRRIPSWIKGTKVTAATGRTAHI
jgi:2-polyprenyl-6-methoxyphenol hydroxylase-like FAD-dependent oxidoreductase